MSEMTWGDVRDVAAAAVPDRLVIDRGWKVAGGWVVATHDPRLPADTRDDEMDQLLVLVASDGSTQVGTYVQWMSLVDAGQPVGQQSAA